MAANGLPARKTAMKSIHRQVLVSTIVLGTGCFSPDAPPLRVDDTETGSTSTGMAPEDTSSSSSLDEVSSSEGDDGLAEPMGDTTPPEVIDFMPADGTTQVYDETITITFSEPMDQDTVEAAFPEASGFTWNGDGTQVEIESSFPFEEVPMLYDLVVPTSVTDLAGNGLAEAVEVTIGLAALKTATLLHEPGLTGRSFEGIDNTSPMLQAGDNWANLLMHAGISFSLAELDSVLAIRRATFRSQVLWIFGDITEPWLGGMVVDHVVFDDVAHIDDPRVLAAAVAPLFASDGIAVGDFVEVDVTGQLESSWSEGIEYFQLRLHPQASNYDDVESSLLLRRGADENDAFVPEGFTEPDPDNQSRIEIEYFQ
jgi:hypothetical protein